MKAPTASPPAAPSPDPLVGTVVAERFRVTAFVARGSAGKVYKAEQLGLGRVVALKILEPQEDFERSRFNDRFTKEAATLARLSHPNTVRVFDYGQWAGKSYLAMEFVDGRSLREIFASGPMPPARLLHLAHQIAASLREAHAVGLVHRDLKPGNILVTRVADDPDFVKVLDFGLVKDVEDAVEMTGDGLMLGTPTYMAPEQIRGFAIDERVDVYALGVLLFRGLAGEPPFKQPQTASLLMAHLTDLPPTIVSINPNARLPAALDWLVMRCLEKAPEDRPANMVEVSKAIRICTIVMDNPAFAAFVPRLEGGLVVAPPELADTTWSTVSRVRDPALVSARTPPPIALAPSPERADAWRMAGVGAALVLLALLMMLAALAVGASGVLSGRPLPAAPPAPLLASPPPAPVEAPLEVAPPVEVAPSVEVAPPVEPPAPAEPMMPMRRSPKLVKPPADPPAAAPPAVAPETPPPAIDRPRSDLKDPWGN